MADKIEKTEKKKGGMMKLVIMGAAALVLLGGGIAGGVVAAQAGMFGGGGATAEHGKGNAKKAKAAKSESGGHGGGSSESAEGSSHYYAMEQGFTTNLKNSDSFVQASVAVSGEDETIAESVKANEPAMRSAILTVLADQEYDTVVTTEGRKQLREKLKDVLNEELENKVGSGGIDNVYFTAFVLQ